ncbi:ATG13 Autophagy-related protein 13 [Candida maltosa Xu316]
MLSDTKQSPLDDPQSKLQIAKLTQVIQKFFTKSCQIILESRAYPDINTPSLYPTKEESSKLNKWFNLYMNSISELSKDDLKIWKTTDLTNMHPMIIETYIDLRKLPSNQTLVLFDDEKHPWTVAKSGGKKTEVVLERWLIEFEPNNFNNFSISDNELPLSYKQAIILFRSIYGYSRLMPAFKVKKNLRNKLPLGNKVLDGNQPISSKGRIGLSKPIINSSSSSSSSSDSHHMTQKFFQPVQTSLGSLKISVAYRNDSDFCIHENEELLSTHFKKHDEQKQQQEEDTTSSEIQSSARRMIAPISSQPSNQTAIRIQPFKVGSMSSTSPPSIPTLQNQPILQSSSLERRVSITSNKSTSNASLAAFLRNPRSGTPSTNTIPIVNTNPIYGTSVPRSIGSSVGHEDSFLRHGDSTNNTPRFSSSFGSRASRRFSSTSIRQQTPQSDFMGRSNSVDEALSEGGDTNSGDDDIGNFIRMLDSKSDLRLGNNSGISSSSVAVNDTISKYQLLRSQHQQLTDSINASLVLQSRQSSRKSSLNSPPPQQQQQNVISSIHSRMKDSRSSSNVSSPSRYERGRSSSINSKIYSPPPAQPTTTTTMVISSSTSSANGINHNKSSATTAIVSGLATSPSVYDYRSSRYDDVFEDDEGNIDSSGSHDDGDKDKIRGGGSKDEDEDDLLFTMSDMNSKPF